MVAVMAVILLLGMVLAWRPGMDTRKLVGLVLLVVCIVWCLAVMLGVLAA